MYVLNMKKIKIFNLHIIWNAVFRTILERGGDILTYEKGALGKKSWEPLLVSRDPSSERFLLITLKVKKMIICRVTSQ